MPDWKAIAAAFVLGMATGAGKEVGKKVVREVMERKEKPPKAGKHFKRL